MNSPPPGASNDPLIGYEQIATLAQVQRSTCHMWRKRNQLPDPSIPSQHRNQSPLWRRSVIVTWLESTGRAPWAKDVHDHLGKATA